MGGSSRRPLASEGAHRHGLRRLLAPCQDSGSQADARGRARPISNPGCQRQEEDVRATDRRLAEHQSDG